MYVRTLFPLGEIMNTGISFHVNVMVFFSWSNMPAGEDEPLMVRMWLILYVEAKFSQGCPTVCPTVLTPSLCHWFYVCFHHRPSSCSLDSQHLLTNASPILWFTGTCLTVYSQSKTFNFSSPLFFITPSFGKCTFAKLEVVKFFSSFF